MAAAAPLAGACCGEDACVLWFPKILSGRIRTVRQNQRIIAFDSRDPPLACSGHCHVNAGLERTDRIAFAHGQALISPPPLSAHLERETSIIWRKVLTQLWTEKTTKNDIATSLHLPLDELEGLIWNLAGVAPAPISGGIRAVI